MKFSFFISSLLLLSLTIAACQPSTGEFKHSSLYFGTLIDITLYDVSREQADAIFNALDRDEAEHLLEKFLRRYETSAPALVAWAEEAIPEGFTEFALPPSHRRRLRTTNLVERLNQEIRRRTRVTRLFPNEAACLRLVSAVLMEISEEWQTAERRYVVFTDPDAIEG